MIVFKLDVSDQVVVQDYRQVSADHAEFTGHGVFMIDRADDVAATAPQTPILWWFFDSEGYRRSRRMALAGRRIDLGAGHARGIAEHRFAVADEQLNYRIRVIRPSDR